MGDLWGFRAGPVGVDWVSGTNRIPAIGARATHFATFEVCRAEEALPVDRKGLIAIPGSGSLLLP
jgi:hypothetical protein